MLENIDKYLNEGKTTDIKVGDAFKTNGGYPSYKINKIDDSGFVHYTIHTPDGSSQSKMKLTMFKRIKGLKKTS